MWLYEHGREAAGPFAPASVQEQAIFQSALDSGKSFFMRGYHGYHLKMVVKARQTEAQHLVGRLKGLVSSEVGPFDFVRGQKLPGFAN